VYRAYPATSTATATAPSANAVQPTLAKKKNLTKNTETTSTTEGNFASFAAAVPFYLAPIN